ncbi:hypothetical protein CkaCkLH20_07184 [Colletotrichum karsti]|uniref:DUF7770 domain-containing protein n=1 Tax=Colletotrichum karsti TaxID=1095194 RepID=A0A9P6I3H8_9PEZI|nr:uncharacterized protein CkaCkLH20_07184 [Colletotrichum karsti]KAF9875364.1 hypothetical protein CkaCkLH20_07184 [Colletotrichum karsti]
MTASTQSGSIDQGAGAATAQHFSFFQPPPFDPVQCIPKKDRDQIFGFAVSEANVVAHEPLANGGNHWTFYLTVASKSLGSDERRLVQLDCTPSGMPAGGGGSGSKVNIVVSLLDDQKFSRAQCICRMSIRELVTVDDFVDVITKHGRHKYVFDDKGRGCKKWVADQMNLFLETGVFVQEYDVKNAKKDMMFQWDNFQRVGDHSDWAVGVYYQ